MPADDIPALLGGTPVRPQGPPPWPPTDPAVADALARAVADGSWGRYHGPHLPTLADRLAADFGVAHAIPCASGTLAVEVALRALKVGAGDEVVLGGYDYEANFLTVHALGATPVLTDVLPGNAAIDLARLDASAGPACKAVLISHLHGGLADMPAVVAWARGRGVGVVEDAAQAAGAVVAGRPAGSWGDFGVLSFGGSKLLTAGGRGGALLTSRADLAQRARLLLRRGPQEWAALSELQAAVLLPQLDALASRTATRAAAVRELRQHLAGVPGLEPFENGPLDATPAFYKLGFWYDAEAFGLPRARFVEAVRAEGVALDEGFRALHTGRSAGRFRAGGTLDVAEWAGRAVVILHHPVLAAGPSAVREVAAAVRKAYDNAHRLRDG
jgi:dTDP-4-amino-4,6-dideoxygalactose transaminase